eukprot:2202492-Rhodomonas_salina.1
MMQRSRDNVCAVARMWKQRERREWQKTHRHIDTDTQTHRHTAKARERSLRRDSIIPVLRVTRAKTSLHC